MAERIEGSGWSWWLYLVGGIFLLIIGGGYTILSWALPAPVETAGTVEGFELYQGGRASDKRATYCYELKVAYEVNGRKYSKTTRQPVANFRDCSRTQEEATGKGEAWIGREVAIFYDAALPGKPETGGERSDLASSTPALALIGIVTIGWCIYDRRKRSRPPAADQDSS